MRVLLSALMTCALLAIGLSAGCGTTDSTTQPGSGSGSGSGNDAPSPATPANLVEVTITALKSAALITDAQATALRTSVDAEMATMTLLATPNWDKAAFAFSKHIPSGVALDKYIAVVWSKGMEAAGGESKKEESLISMLKQSSAAWLDNAANLKLLGAATSAHLGMTSETFAEDNIAPKVLASLLTTSDARFEKISSGFAAALMRGQNQFATIDPALATNSKAIAMWLADVVTDAEITDTGTRGAQLISAMFDAMEDATDPNRTTGLLDVSAGIARGVLAGMLPGLSSSEQKSLAEEIPATALDKASGGGSGLGFSVDYVIRILSREMAAGVADAEKAAPSAVDFDALLIAMSAKFPFASFFAAADPGACNGVAGLSAYAGRGLAEGGDPEGQVASYAKSFAFVYAELIKGSGPCSITVNFWDQARDQMKAEIEDSTRAAAFETAMNAIVDSTYDSTSGVVGGSTPCDKAKVAFDATHNTAPFIHGKFICNP